MSKRNILIAVAALLVVGAGVVAYSFSDGSALQGRFTGGKMGGSFGGGRNLDGVGFGGSGTGTSSAVEEVVEIVKAVSSKASIRQTIDLSEVAFGAEVSEDPFSDYAQSWVAIGDFTVRKDADDSCSTYYFNLVKENSRGERYESPLYFIADDARLRIDSARGSFEEYVYAENSHKSDYRMEGDYDKMDVTLEVYASEDAADFAGDTFDVYLGETCAKVDGATYSWKTYAPVDEIDLDGADEFGLKVGQVTITE